MHLLAKPLHKATYCIGKTLQPVSDLDGIGPPALRKRGLPNVIAVAPKDSIAGDIMAHVIAVSPAPCYTNNLSRLAFPSSQMRLQVLPRQTTGRLRLKSADFRRNGILDAYPVNHIAQCINSHAFNPVDQPTCAPQPPGTRGTVDSSKSSRRGLCKVQGPTNARWPTNRRFKSPSAWPITPRRPASLKI